MIDMSARTDVISDDVETLVVTILKGIELADKIGASYKLEITRNDVAVISAALKHITNVEVS